MELKAGEKSESITISPNAHLTVTVISGSFTINFNSLHIKNKTFPCNCAGLCFDENVSEYIAFYFEATTDCKLNYELS